MTRSLVEQAFGTSSFDLYIDVLKCSREVNQAQLRKAYYKQARNYHPDKNQVRYIVAQEYSSVNPVTVLIAYFPMTQYTSRILVLR
jgi:hypothetical protein